MPVGSELAALFEARRLKAAEAEYEPQRKNDPSVTAQEQSGSPSPIDTAAEGSISAQHPPVLARQSIESEIFPRSINPPAANLYAVGPQNPLSEIKHDEGEEDGVPTPAFLLNARKNLKPTNTSFSGTTTPLKKSTTEANTSLKKSGEIVSSNNVGIGKVQVIEKSRQGQGKNDVCATAKTNESTQFQDHAPRDELKNYEESDSTATTESENVVTANRSRQSASKIDEPSRKLSPTTDTSSETKLNNTEKTPSYLRREKLLAKVMSQRGTAALSPRPNRQLDCGNDKSRGKESSKKGDGIIPHHAVKITVTSPKVDEVEMLFAETNLKGESISVDSISNEMKGSLAGTSSSSTTLPTSNLPLHDNNNVTPEKEQMSQNHRLQLASTPKIRGNFQHRREHFNESEGGRDQPTVRLSPRTQSLKTSPRIDEQQAQYQFQTGNEKPNIHNTYSINDRAPSTISQLSGLSTPSCFPPDVPSHLQQPILGLMGGGGIISSSPSFGNTSTNSAFNGVPSTPSSALQVGVAKSAFSPGVESENRRLRDQLASMQQKLDEKDAIISQLMKRISNLEAHRGIQQDSSAMSALWEHSQPAFQTNCAGESYYPFPMRTNSHDTDFSSASSNHNRMNPHGTVKQSPTTTTTASTASVTTSSSKSRDFQRPQPGRSRPSQSAQSPRKKDSSTHDMKRSPSKPRSLSSSSKQFRSNNKRSSNGNGNHHGNDRVFIC
ncbi:hypothetical protein ACHAXS_006774 [Conticribra weissflogii]